MSSTPSTRLAGVDAARAASSARSRLSSTGMRSRSSDSLAYLTNSSRSRWARRRAFSASASARSRRSCVSSRWRRSSSTSGPRAWAASADAEDADHLIVVEVRRGDQRALAHLGVRVLLADHDAQPLALGEHGHEVGEALLLLERAQEVARRLDVPELGVVEHVDGAADVQRSSL